ncbi:MAG: Uncharacterised protein [Cellulomonadaceae bacterium TMED98]|nr:MAG: Uncharacterised protein [Cellulomonadaceae bacterium TMED98]
MVSHDPHAHIVAFVSTVAFARHFFGGVENGTHLVNFIHIRHALFDEGDALHAHPGVDVLLGKLTLDVEIDFAADVVNQVLHKHEVPDFEVSRVIDCRTTFWPEFGAAVEIDF